MGRSSDIRLWLRIILRPVVSNRLRTFMIWRSAVKAGSSVKRATGCRTLSITENVVPDMSPTNVVARTSVDASCRAMKPPIE